MFFESFFSFPQSFGPFFLFFFSSFLGACEPSDGVASRGVLKAKSTANLERIYAKVGAKSHANLGHFLLPKNFPNGENASNDVNNSASYCNEQHYPQKSGKKPLEFPVTGPWLILP
jgi:hypothetical protein